MSELGYAGNVILVVIPFPTGKFGDQLPIQLESADSLIMPNMVVNKHQLLQSLRGVFHAFYSTEQHDIFRFTPKVAFSIRPKSTYVGTFSQKVHSTTE